MPRYEDVSVVWRGGDIIWKNSGPEARKRQIRQQITRGSTHILREVGLEHPDYPKPFDRDCIDAILGEAEAEYQFLDSLGLHIPNYTWRVTGNDPRTLRVLAKINVIEGHTPAYDSPEAQTVREAMQSYFDTNRAGRKLYDIDSAAQYVVGVPRKQSGMVAGTQTAIHLVDIEPRFA